jgi:hypothetical protein
LRALLAVLVGLAVAVGVVWSIQLVGHQVYPPPADLDFGDVEEFGAYVAELPTGAFAFLLAAWAIGTWAGAALAGALGKGPRPAVVVGLLLLVATVVNLALYPHPTWVAGAGVALVIAATALAARGARRRARR